MNVGSNNFIFNHGHFITVDSGRLDGFRWETRGWAVLARFLPLDALDGLLLGVWFALADRRFQAHPHRFLPKEVPTESRHDPRWKQLHASSEEMSPSSPLQSNLCHFTWAFNFRLV